MKSLITLFLIALAIAVAFILTKPTDEQCLDLIKSKVQTSIVHSNNSLFFKQILNSGFNLGFNSIKSGFCFQDKTFYKEVYFGNIRVGTAYFGTFSVDKNFENAIASLREQTEERNRQRIEAARSLFKHHEETQSIGNDLETVNRQLDDAYAQLNKLNQFHLLRSNGRKERQIAAQEQYIQQLEQRKRQLEYQ